jgi:hypothetical protein
VAVSIRAPDPLLLLWPAVAPMLKVIMIYSCSRTYTDDKPAGGYVVDPASIVTLIELERHLYIIEHEG